MPERRPINVFVTGTRGIPDIPGGIETHCQMLYPRIRKGKYQITVCIRAPYRSYQDKTWQGIRLLSLFSPKARHLEAIVHTFLAILSARIKGCRLIHIHAVGPALLLPMARLLGMRTVFTHHGPDYLKENWGRAARFFLRLGERLGCLFAHEVIVISSETRTLASTVFKRRYHQIPNGVQKPEQPGEHPFLDELDLHPQRYVLAVARFVPEKGLDLLVRAFGRLKQPGLKLVLVGDAGFSTPYTDRLNRMIQENENIIKTGYLTGSRLNQLFANTLLFVLPSYHEGLPIALLEAMSHGISVLASDIAANLEIGLPETRYFRNRDAGHLVQRLEFHIKTPVTRDEKRFFNHLITTRYNWEKIAKKTAEVYASALSG